jgi:hypothetical protein
LDECVSGSHAALELFFQRIEFFTLLMPHELNVTNRAGVIEKQEEVLEEF